MLPLHISESACDHLLDHPSPTFLKELAGDPAHRFLQHSAWGPASTEKTVRQELASTSGHARTGCPLTNSSLEVVMSAGLPCFLWGNRPDIPIELFSQSLLRFL